MKNFEEIMKNSKQIIKKNSKDLIKNSKEQVLLLVNTIIDLFSKAFENKMNFFATTKTFF